MKVSKIRIYKDGTKWRWKFSVTYEGFPSRLEITGLRHTWAEALDQSLQEHHFRVMGW